MDGDFFNIRMYFSWTRLGMASKHLLPDIEQEMVLPNRNAMSEAPLKPVKKLKQKSCAGQAACMAAHASFAVSKTRCNTKP
jgi:hypothetical protein